MRNYKNLTESIQRRVNPDKLNYSDDIRHEFSQIAYSDVLTFIRSAMKAVEPEYTKRSVDAGNRVKSHLNEVLTSITYRFQGSVTTDTHIKGASDIDLLVISEKFYGWDMADIQDILNTTERRAKYKPSSIQKLEGETKKTTYSGDSLADLHENRLKSETKLYSTYDKCETHKAKSIQITNLSLKRDVDVVIAGWYDNVRSVVNDKGDYRGVKIYNKETQRQESVDFPFLRAKYLNEKNSSVNGRLKRMIRFIKNCKALSNATIDLSSFDINSICYDIPTEKYSALAFYELVSVIYNQLKLISENQLKADSIKSIDGAEYIFRNNSSKVNQLRIILSEVEAIYFDLLENSELTLA